MKKSIFFFILIIYLPEVFVAQPHQFWQPLDTEVKLDLNGDLKYSDNFQKVIFTGAGSALDIEDSVVIFMPAFDGEQWQALTNDISYGIQTLVDFQNGILVGGLSAQLSGQNMPHMAYFDGEHWSFPYVFNGDITKLKWLNDTLYALGWFTEIDNNEAYRVAALVDGVWQGKLSADIAEYIPGWHFTDIEYFNGEIYLCGNFWVQPNAQSNNLDGPIIGFGKLKDGWIVRPKDAHYFTGPTVMRKMLTYHDKLYFGGGTTSSGAGAGHAIHWFDGTNISPVPHPPRMWYEEFQTMTVGGVLDMVVNGNFLYAGGVFNHMGEETLTGNVVRWDGQQWCGLFATDFVDIFQKMAFINDQMIMINPFVYEYVYPFPSNSYWIYTGGEAVSNCTEPLSARDDTPSTQFTLYPNPAHTYATLSAAQQPLEHLAVYDLQGRLVHEAQPRAASYRIPLTGLPAGMYVVQVQVGGDVLRKKLVVE